MMSALLEISEHQAGDVTVLRLSGPARTRRR
jgi:hypothetical protein